MLKALTIVFAGVLVVVVVGAFGGHADVAEPNVRELVFFAVLEGLYTDGVQNDAVERIIMRKEKGPNPYIHFVYGCPICAPAVNAFLVYRERRDFYGWKRFHDTFGSGLPEPVRAKLLSEDGKQRLDAIHGLIRRWVDKRLNLMNLDRVQRGRWNDALEKARKEGMMVLESSRRAGRGGLFDDGCAVCDGAVEASEDR